MILVFQIWKLKFQNFEMISDEKIVYIKVIDPDQIYNFVVENIFIWDCYNYQMVNIRY